MSRLERLDKHRLLHPSEDLDSEIALVWRDYQKFLDEEEIFWFQKSGARWLHHGDRNTRYFHGVMAIRRRKNRYESLMNNEGAWINNQDVLEKMVVDYYKEIST